MLRKKLEIRLNLFRRYAVEDWQSCLGVEKYSIDLSVGLAGQIYEDCQSWDFQLRNFYYCILLVEFERKQIMGKIKERELTNFHIWGQNRS